MNAENLAQRLAVVRLLADGGSHSSTSVADHARINVAQLPDILAALADRGLQVVSAAGSHQLPEAIELLDASEIASALEFMPTPELELFGEVESTNTVLRRSPPAPGAAAVCLAEYQHAGRGRLGRTWLMPFASGLCFSLSGTFAKPASQLSGLSLAVGVAVRAALIANGVQGVALKWPNDLLLGGGKLGGILVEVLNAGSARSHVIAGVGINVSLSATARQAVLDNGGQAAAINDVVAGISRNALAAALLNAVQAAFQRYEANGLDAFRDAWNEADGLRDKPVRVFAGRETVDGVARGIDSGGALAVDVAEGRRHFAGGEISLRRISDVAD